MQLIKQAKLIDVERIAPLFDAYRRFYEQSSSLALATQFLTDRLHSQESIIFFVENNSGEVLGFTQLYPTFCSVEASKIFTLYDLFVLPSIRGLGVGKALLLYAENYARTQSFSRLDLTTAKNNHTAQRLYESLGWVREDVFLTYQRFLS